MNETLSIPFSINLNITPGILWIVFLVVLVLYMIISLMMVFHWKEYAYNKPALTIAMLSYFIVSGGLIWFAVISLLLYSESAL